MALNDAHHAVTFSIGLEGHKPLSVTLLPWSQMLRPLNVHDYMAMPFDNVHAQKFHQIWDMPLDGIRDQVTREEWALWASEIPERLLGELRQQGLDTVGALCLVCNVPEVAKFLPVPYLFREVVRSWQESLEWMTFSVSFASCHRQSSLPWVTIVSRGIPADLNEFAGVILRFVRYFHGKYQGIDGCFWARVLYDYASYLPYFLNSRMPFRRRLETMRAFCCAATANNIPANVMHPLFYRVLRTQEKVRLNDLTLLIQRLKATAQSLEKPSIHGVLKGAPSFRFLKRYLKRQEKLLKDRMLSGQGTDFEHEPPEFPDYEMGIAPYIEPLLTVNALTRESVYMSNCIATFERDIRKGERAAFRMAWPVRATVLLSRTESGWKVDDARTFHDRIVTIADLKKIEAWISGKTLNMPRSVANPFLLEKVIPHPYWLRFHPYEIDEDALVEDMNEWMDDDLGEDLEDELYYELEWQFDPALTVPDTFNENMEVPPQPPDPDIHFIEVDDRHGCRVSLPDRMGKWVRVLDAQTFQLSGFDDDMITPAMTALMDSQDKALYVHPSLPLYYVMIYDMKDPVTCYEMVRHHVPWQTDVPLWLYQKETEFREQMYEFVRAG